MTKNKKTSSELAVKDVKLTINETALNDFGIVLETGINSILDKYNDEDITYEMISSVSSCAAQIAAEVGMPKKDFMTLVSDYYDDTIKPISNDIPKHKNKKELN